MAGNDNDIHAPRGGRKKPATIIPSRIIPESEWNRPISKKWSGQQPYYARASFTKMCLPAMLYSLVLNASQKMLSFVPFTTRLRIDVERLSPNDCLAPLIPPSPGKGKDESNVNAIAIVTVSNDDFVIEIHITMSFEDDSQLNTGVQHWGRIRDRLVSCRTRISCDISV